MANAVSSPETPGGLISGAAHESAPVPLRVPRGGHLSLLQAVATLARESTTAEPPANRALLRRFRDNARRLASTTAHLARLTAEGKPVPAETEWLLDNNYIIDEVIREVRTDLPRGYYRELPALDA